MSELLNETEVAKKLRVSLACLRRWRLEKRGPMFLKIGPLVRYSAIPTGRPRRLASVLANWRPCPDK